jgi:hypothetical protein
MRSPYLLFLAFFLFGLIHIPLQAQVTTSSINGIILDEGGEPLIGATVLATHDPSGITYGTTTRVDGGYVIPNMRIGGPYSIEVSYIGYEAKQEGEVFLQLGQKHVFNYSLESASTQLSEVVVTGGRNTILGGDRTGAETNVTSDQLTKLPTISRSASDFTRLTPAANGGSFAGRNDQYNNFSLDGSIFNNPFGLDAATPGGQTAAQPVSLDAIDQINVSLAPFDVTRAGFTGAAIDAVTKSGTNHVSGTVFGYFRNSGMTGGSVKGTELATEDLSQLQAGFTLGFPLIKNKLFAMVNAEIDNRDELGTTWVPAGAGATGANVSRVTATDMQAISNALMDRYGYDTGALDGYIHDTKSTKGIVKLDYVINRDHQLSATYNFLDASKDKTAHPSAIGRRGPDQVTLQFENSGYRINNIIHSGILELRSVFGNKYSNKLQVGYTKFDDSRDPKSEPFPTININNAGIRYIVAGHEPFSIHNRLNQGVLQFTNNFNIYAGKHTFTVGTSFEKFEFDNSFNLGTYDGVFGPGYASVDAFLSLVSSGEFDAQVTAARDVFAANGGDDGVEGEGWALAETNVGQWGVYAQDEIQINDKLNVTVGLRLDIPLYFDTAEKIDENIARNCCYNPDNVWYDENGEAITFVQNELPSNKPLISPRIGFNYDVYGDRTMQIRGGSGLFAGRLPFVWIGNHVANPNEWFYNVTHPDYKFPQVWKTNLGVDHKMNNGWITSLDLIYTKDIHATMVRNYGIKPPTGALQGVDNRAIYTGADKAHPFGFNAYVLTNTDIGYTFNASLQAQKSFENDMFLMFGYNYSTGEDATSIEAEISSDAYERNPAFGHVNTAIGSPSLYITDHRLIAAATKGFTYGNWKTTISIFTEYAKGGTTPDDFTSDYRFSHTYSGDLNNDGSGLNDLIYVPTESELSQMNFTSDAERTAFGAYIAQDEYLSSIRGDYAEKYASVAPWYNTWDLKILQDYNFKVGEKTNTVQFSIDVFNIGNLISSDWGVKQLPANTQPVGVSVDDAGVPTYSFDTNLTSTFVSDFSLLSRWQAKLGLRYIF